MYNVHVLIASHTVFVYVFNNFEYINPHTKTKTNLPNTREIQFSLEKTEGIKALDDIIIGAHLL